MEGERIDLSDISTVRRLMAMFGLRFHKEFGQNFLTDGGIVREIADACSTDRSCTVLEIGPGIGTLTRELAANYKKVVALEIDENLLPVLKFTLTGFENATVHRADVLKVDLGELLKEDFQNGKVAVCANLPYYITSPILMYLLEGRLPFTSITVMVQEEVADRICADPGTKDYGAITPVIGYYASAIKLFRVPADRFLPAPKVDSAVVRLTLWQDGERPCHPKDEALFFKTIKAAFGQRRKTLLNALSAGFPERSKEQLREAITSLGLDPNIRGERLSVLEFSDLSDRLGSQLFADSASTR